MNLLIVESPGKVKKIQSILGSGWTVAASFGHIRDLPIKEFGVTSDYTPQYEWTERAQNIIPKLKSLAKQADSVYLATDPDREGEAIAWHLLEELKSDIKKHYRVTFSEITEKAIKTALASPRQIDMNLVRAQEARRVLDRLVGYRISPKVSNKAGQSLSAGRVQSVALRVIVETEESIKSFVPVNHYSVEMLFNSWKAELETKEFIPKGEKYLLDKSLAENIAKLRDFTIAEITDENKPKTPPAPFTTSTLQRAAQNQYGYAPAQTMKIAQELYEGGFITYMRTDSPNLSDDAYNEIKEYCAVNNIKCVSKKRTWEAKESAQEAHEAIRPAHIKDKSCGDSKEQQELYALIRNRAIASQMPDAIFASRTVILKANQPVNNINTKFTAKGSTLIVPGWKALTDEDQAEEDPKKVTENPIPKQIEKDTAIKAAEGKVLDKKTTPPSRYSQSGLIEFMEKKGVGRPATYAAIMDNIIKREYVREEKKGKRSMLVPTPKGEMLLKLLRVSDMSFLKYDYTSAVEQQLDDIAMGKKTYIELMRTEDKAIDTAIENLAKQKGRWSCPKCGGDISRWQSKDKKDEYYWSCRDRECKSYFVDLNGQPAFPSTEHRCDKCGKPLIIKNGKTGRFWSCTGYPDCKRTYPDNNGKPDKSIRRRGK